MRLSVLVAKCYSTIPALFVVASALSAAVALRPVYASCVADADWPGKPCLDTPPYTKSELAAAWDEYYDYKGREWMEMKKAEMDRAVENGTLKEWAGYREEPRNFANFNVYFYYYLHDQAPDINGYASIVVDDSRPAAYWWHGAAPATWAAIIGWAPPVRHPHCTCSEKPGRNSAVAGKQASRQVGRQTS